MKQFSTVCKTAAQRCALLSFVGTALVLGQGTSCAQAPGTTPVTKAPEQLVQQTFVYEAAPDTKSVAIAGTFNNWDRSANPLTRDETGNQWRTTLKSTFR
jgi:hypothetical protein